MLKIARNFVLNLLVGACTASATVTQKTRCRNCLVRDLPDGSETKLCSTCLVEAEAIVKKKYECLVIDCKDGRNSRHSTWQYCKKHSDPKTRCINCKTRGLEDGSPTWCSFCLVEVEAIVKEKQLEREARKLEKVQKKQLEREAGKLKKQLEREARKVAPKKRISTDSVYFLSHNNYGISIFVS